MEGESPLLKEGALSLQTSLSHRELPPCPRHLRSEDLFRFSRVAETWGKFFCVCGGVNLLQGAASRPFCGWGRARNDTRVVPARLKDTSLWGADLSPLVSRLRDKLPAVFFPPRGSLFARFLFVLRNKVNGQKYREYLLLNSVFTMFAQRKEGFPLGGRKLQAVCRASD